MESEKNELEELSQEIRKNIEANRKFLERVMDEDFEADEMEESEAFEEL